MILVSLAACGGIRVVNRSQQGGTIALHGDRNNAMEKAHAEMSRHCGPNNYTIVSEGETVVGTDSAATSETYQEKDGTVVQEAGQSTRDAVEWRVVYQCGMAQPAPMGPPPEPVGPPPPPPGPPPGRI
ncbi:MAG: hypothetical protein R3B48_20035 [Kofleriaceae bacterium]